MGVCDDGAGARAGLIRAFEGRTEALADTFNLQDVANTLWAYATMGREPGAGLMSAGGAGGGSGGHVQDAEGGKHAVGVFDDGEETYQTDDPFDEEDDGSGVSIRKVNVRDVSGNVSSRVSGVVKTRNRLFSLGKL